MCKLGGADQRKKGQSHFLENSIKNYTDYEMQGKTNLSLFQGSSAMPELAPAKLDELLELLIGE